MLTVIKTGGKQYLVKAKSKLKVEKIEGAVVSEVIFDQILLQTDEQGDKVEFGTPVLKGAKVKAKILKQGRGRKVEVVKFKRKTRYHKKYGHRQPFTEIEIE